jgi:hypothetical protein
MKLVPFISQITGVPSSFCQRMSALPSPLKSPTPTACQLGPGFAMLLSSARKTALLYTADFSSVLQSNFSPPLIYLS